MPRWSAGACGCRWPTALIPVIADEYVDREFGTGVVKVTPAHDQNDYAVGQRHGLPMIVVLTLDATLNDNAPAAYRGLDRFVARKKIVADLDALGLLVETKKHRLTVPRCARTGQVVEPMLTHQWFVATTKPGADGKSIAEGAIEAVRSGQVRFVPEQWVNTYNHWMNNIQDWCISRQLWWGHQIPAWYGTGGEIFVGRNEDEARGRAATGRLHRPADARRGRARHLVQLGAGALLHARLARDHGPGGARAAALPAEHGARHRLRHHLLLGRPDDHDDEALHRPGAVPRRLHPRPGARRAWPQDEQERRQRARPGRPDRRHRAGTAAGQAHHRPAQARDRAARAQGHGEGVSAGHPGLRRRRAALHDGELRHRSGATSTSTPSAARATATSATSSGTPPSSCS